MMSDDLKVVTVDATNVAEQGFFCYKSKPKSEGYRQKLNCFHLLGSAAT
jgi:hypothetical protein